MEKLLKYEFKQQVAQYLLRATEAQQIRGAQQAKDLLTVQELLANPANKAELEKQSLEELKAKYEPKLEQKEKVEEKK